MTTIRNLGTSVNIEILSYRFKYDGKWRIVDNVTWEKEHIIGFERRKNGRYSNKIKRYAISKIFDMNRIPALTDRTGGIARP